MEDDEIEVFETYAPSKLKVGKAHPTAMVETVSLSYVAPPEPSSATSSTTTPVPSSPPPPPREGREPQLAAARVHRVRGATLASVSPTAARPASSATAPASARDGRSRGDAEHAAALGGRSSTTCRSERRPRARRAPRPHGGGLADRRDEAARREREGRRRQPRRQEEWRPVPHLQSLAQKPGRRPTPRVRRRQPSWLARPQLPGPSCPRPSHPAEGRRRHSVLAATRAAVRHQGQGRRRPPSSAARSAARSSSASRCRRQAAAPPRRRRARRRRRRPTRRRGRRRRRGAAAAARRERRGRASPWRRRATEGWG